MALAAARRALLFLALVVSFAACNREAISGDQPDLTIEMAADLSGGQADLRPSCRAGLKRVGEACAADNECGSCRCQAGRCAPCAPSCVDDFRNGDETDIDCGGARCPACRGGRTCGAAKDCLSGVCQAGRCTTVPFAVTFERAPNAASGVIYPFVIAAADVNADGIRDVITAGGATVGEVARTEVGAALGKGDGTFHPPTISQAVEHVHSIAVGDFNQDCKIDLVVGSANDDRSLALGMGDGRFSAPVPIPGKPIGEVRAADFDGDGVMDLLAYSRTNCSLLLANGDGTFRIATSFGPAVFLSVAMLDLNGDGRLDLVGGVSQGDFPVYLNAGGGQLLRSGAILASPKPSTGKAYAGDFDGDQRGDILVYDFPSYAIAFGRGNGTFGTLVPTVGFVRGGSDLFVEDLDGDGKSDIFNGSPGAEDDQIFFSQGSGRFLDHPLKGVSSSSANAADLNLDGLPDILVAAPDRNSWREFAPILARRK